MESLEKEKPVRKEEGAVSEAKWKKNFKEQVINWICPFICFKIKQDAKRLVQDEHQGYII